MVALDEGAGGAEGDRDDAERHSDTPARRASTAAIVSGALPAGALVPNEDDLRAEISASRTAYREAIRFLAGKGLIEAKPRSGKTVHPVKAAKSTARKATVRGSKRR